MLAPVRPLGSAVDYTVPFREYAAGWLWRQMDPQWKRKPRTIQCYRQALRHDLDPLIGDLPVSSITRRLVFQLLDRLRERLAPCSIQTPMAVLSGVLNDAVYRGVLEYNVAAGIRLSRARKRPRPALPQEKLDAYLACAYRVKPKYAAVLALCAHGGLRVSEALALRADDIDFTARTVHIRRGVNQNGEIQDSPKNNKPRVIVMGKSLRDALREPCRRASGPHGWLFPGRVGLVRYRSIMRFMHAIEAELRTDNLGGTHVFRKTFVSIRAANGVAMEALTRTCGHATQQQTEGYVDRETIPLSPRLVRQLLQY